MILLYVALSRVKSLKGLHLHQMKNPRDMDSDNMVPSLDPITRNCKHVFGNNVYCDTV